jgi:hypothetical protein
MHKKNMATNFENDLSNTSLDDEYLVDSSFNRNPSYETNINHDTIITKDPKSTLKCVVCGDKALGKK